MSKDKPQPLSGWQTWLKQLSPAAQKALTEPRPIEVYDDEAEDYAYFRRGLSESAREALDALPGVGDEDDAKAEPEPMTLRFCCIENPEGEIPCLRIFKTPQALVRRLGELEGEDIYVLPFFGVPLRFSTGPQRYLALPDGIKAMMIPVVKGGPCKVFDADLLEFEPQEDFYLGPRELVENILAEELAKKKNTIDAEIVEDEDEDEEAADDEDIDPNYDP